MEERTHLEVENEIFCHNLHEYEMKEIDLYTSNEAYETHRKLMDTSTFDQMYGPSYEGIPTLEVLSIRALHKAGFPFAKGETDGAIIQCKGLKWMAESMKDEEKSSD